MSSLKAPTLTATQVIDGCGGHDRQAVVAVQLKSVGDSVEVMGVLRRDPIVFRSDSKGRTQVVCELEYDGRFRADFVQFMQNGQWLLVGFENEVRMYELETGATIWSHAVPWRELLVGDINTVFWIDQHEQLVTLDARSGAIISRRDFNGTKGRVHAAINSGVIEVVQLEVGTVFSRKIASNTLFLLIDATGHFSGAFGGSAKSTAWRHNAATRPRAIELLQTGALIVALFDGTLGRGAFINARTGVAVKEFVVPTQQAEGLTIGALSDDEKWLGIGTSLGRIVLLSLT